MHDIPKSPARSRARSRPARGLSALLAVTLGFAACVDGPTTPNAHGGIDDGAVAPRRTIGLVEITISGLGSGQVTSSALSAPTVAELERLRAVRRRPRAAHGPTHPPSTFSTPAPAAHRLVHSRR